jgi:hypothetical protein
MLFVRKLRASRFEFTMDEEKRVPCLWLTEEQMANDEERQAVCALMEETVRAVMRAKTASQWHAQFVAMHPHLMAQVKAALTQVHNAWEDLAEDDAEKAYVLATDLKKALLVNRAVLSVPSFRMEMCPSVDVCSLADAYEVTEHNMLSVVHTLEQFSHKVLDCQC